MHNFDQLVGGKALRAIGRGCGIHQTFTNMVLDHLADEPIERTPAGSCLLQHSCAVPVLFDRTLNRFDLPAHAPEPIKQLLLLFFNVSHKNSN